MKYTHTENNLDSNSNLMEVRRQVVECPACKLTNPDTAMKCDCGFDFTTGPISTASNPFQQNEVVIKDIDMPFGSMIVFMVKWAIAAIPALIILTVIFVIIFTLGGSILTGLAEALKHR